MSDDEMDNDQRYSDIASGLMEVTNLTEEEREGFSQWLASMAEQIGDEWITTPLKAHAAWAVIIQRAVERALYVYRE